MTKSRKHVVAARGAVLAFAFVLVGLGCGASSDPPAGGDGSTNASETQSSTVGTAEAEGESSAESGMIGEASSSSADSASSGDVGSSGTAGTTSGAIECEPQPYFTCTMPYDCSAFGVNAFSCGGVSSYIDENGCPRPLCGMGRECPAGMRCHDSAAECGRCMDWLPGCGDAENGDGTISCHCGGDAACGGWVCLPEDEFPLGLCD